MDLGGGGVGVGVGVGVAGGLWGGGLENGVVRLGVGGGGVGVVSKWVGKQHPRKAN